MQEPKGTIERSIKDVMLVVFFYVVFQSVYLAFRLYKGMTLIEALHRCIDHTILTIELLFGLGLFAFLARRKTRN